MGHTDITLLAEASFPNTMPAKCGIPTSGQDGQQGWDYVILRGNRAARCS